MESSEVVHSGKLHAIPTNALTRGTHRSANVRSLTPSIPAASSQSGYQVLRTTYFLLGVAVHLSIKL